MAGREAEHRRGRALARLDALGRDPRDLLEHQRELHRRGPRGPAAGDDRGRRRAEVRQHLLRPRPRRRPIAVASAATAPSSSRSSPASPVTADHSASPAAYAPDSAWVCVTARWCATVCRTVAVAAPASEEDASAVIATHGREPRAARDLDHVAELARRGDREDGVAVAPAEPVADRDAARHGDDRRPVGLRLERGEPERVRHVVGGAVAGRDDPPHAVAAEQRGGLGDPRPRVDGGGQRPGHLDARQPTGRCPGTPWTGTYHDRPKQTKRLDMCESLGIVPRHMPISEASQPLYPGSTARSQGDRERRPAAGRPAALRALAVRRAGRQPRDRPARARGARSPTAWSRAAAAARSSAATPSPSRRTR